MNDMISFKNSRNQLYSLKDVFPLESQFSKINPKIVEKHKSMFITNIKPCQSGFLSMVIKKNLGIKRKRI